jgi:hypothetical protein
METTGILAVIFAASVATSALLGVGGFVGYRFAVVAAGPQIRRSEQEFEQVHMAYALERCSEISETMSQRSEKVTLLVESRSVPPDLSLAIAQLTECSQALANQVREFRRSGSVADEAARPIALCGLPEPAGDLSGRRVFSYAVTADAPTRTVQGQLSAEEMTRYASGVNGIAEEAEEASQRRYPYACLQQLAVWDDAEPQPALADVREVRCHEVWQQGISFFWPEPPGFQRLAISIGSGRNLMFMAAKVVHSKSVYMHHDLRFLVTCQFQHRLVDFTADWLEEQSSAVGAA